MAGDNTVAGKTSIIKFTPTLIGRVQYHAEQQSEAFNQMSSQSDYKVSAQTARGHACVIRDKKEGKKRKKTKEGNVYLLQPLPTAVFLLPFPIFLLSRLFYLICVSAMLSPKPALLFHSFHSSSITFTDQNKAK